MKKTINIPKILAIACCLLTSIISINKLDALTYNSYLRLSGSDSFLTPGYSTSVGSNGSLVFVSLYNLEGTGGLDYYITTTLQMCSTGFYSITANSEDSVFTISKSVKSIGNCLVNGYDGTLYEIKWVRYLPVVNGFDQAVGQVFVQTSPLNYSNFHKFVSTNLTVQTAQVYEQQQTNDKQQQTNDKLDQTNDKLEDLNKNLKSDEIDDNSGFFSNFSSSDHGLAGIITSPLRAINKLTSVCQPVSFNVLDEPIELPCGDTLFWNKEGVQSFKLIWNILVGGPILFLLLKKLFKVVENLKNPDDDRIEVLDL